MNMQHISRYIFDDLLKYVHDRLGFRFTAGNRSKLETKLRNMRLPARWPDLKSFLDDLMAEDSEAHELLVRTITVNHTYFFREKEQIEYMVSIIKSQGMADPHIWSAASSTGEEAYSIAIHLLEKGITGSTIVASDVNSKVLHHMKHGIYHENRLDHLPRPIVQKYFSPLDNFQWKIRPELRGMVAIKKVNLVDRLRFIHSFDFIFCRNVFIYFDEASRAQVLDSLCANLKPGGYLFVGLTEALLNAPPSLAMEGHAIYRRRANQVHR